MNQPNEKEINSAPKKKAKKKVPKKKVLAKVIPIETDSQRMISVIEKAALNPDVDPEKMKQLLDVQLTIMDRQAKIEFDEAMAECQAEMATLAIIKNAYNEQTQSNYAKHEAICAKIKPVYTKHGFRLSFSESKAEVESEYRTSCVVTHRKGHSEKFWIDLPADKAGIKGTVNKTPVHAKGSTMSYGRRYLTLMIFDLPTFDDNDANMPQNNEPPNQTATLPDYPDKFLEKNKSIWTDLINQGKTPEGIIKTVSCKYTLTDEQKQKILDLK